MLQQVCEGLHIGVLGLGRVLLRLVFPLFGPPVLQVEDLCRYVGRNDDLLFRVLDTLFLQSLLPSTLTVFSLKGFLTVTVRVLQLSNSSFSTM